LTPCDFWLWEMVKERGYATKPRDINDLKEHITTAVRSIPTEMCQRAMDCTLDNLHKCIENQETRVEGVY
jgi:DNA-binding transcriptional regulator GbsR (MarR family)